MAHLMNYGPCSWKSMNLGQIGQVFHRLLSWTGRDQRQQNCALLSTNIGGGPSQTRACVPKTEWDTDIVIELPPARIVEVLVWLMYSVPNDFFVFVKQSKWMHCQNKSSFREIIIWLNVDTWIEFCGTSHLFSSGAQAPDIASSIWQRFFILNTPNCTKDWHEAGTMARHWLSHIRRFLHLKTTSSSWQLN